MPITHKNRPCVTLDDLELCGFEKGTVYGYLSRHRSGRLSCWEHDVIGNAAYIYYESLTLKNRSLIDKILCQGVKLPLWLENQESERLHRELERLCRNLAGMVEVSPDEVKALDGSGLYSPQDVQRIARAAGWLRLWRRMSVKTARSYGFTSVTELQQEVFKCCLNEQAAGFVRFPKPINTIRVLDYKAREYAKDGLDCLIGGYFGNVNREKIDGTVHAKLMDLAGNPVKWSFEDIGLFYNTLAKENDLPRMTVSAIKQHLNQPKNKRVWMASRHGKHATDILQLPQIEREPVSRADALWSLDGTTMQLYYKDANGKIKSDLYVYFVVDVYSSAIIGYSVAFSESTGMVAEALKMAIDKHGYRPYQLQYDNGSANIGGAIQGIMNNMSHVHFPCTPYRGNSKYIETYIGHFQQRVLRAYEEFKGGNITTRSLNSKANPELLARLKKEDKFKSESEITALFDDAVNKWNSRGEKRNSYGEFVGETKTARYMHPHGDRQLLNYFEKISLFMGELPKPYQYKQQGVTITLGGKKRNYIVPDMDGIGDFEFNGLHLNESFKVRINPLSPDFITLWQGGKRVATAHIKEKYSACVADMKERGDGAKIKRFRMKAEEYGYEYCMKEMERQREILLKQDLKATGTGGFGWYDTSKAEFNYMQNTVEDVHNGMVEEVDAVRMALLNM